MSDEGKSRINEYLDLMNINSQYVLSFSPFFINHVSVELLTDLVVNRDRSVLYICVGRPHMFVQKILMNRGVTTRSIFFMDMVMYVCREPECQNRATLLRPETGEPVALSTIFKIFKVDQELDSLSLDEVDLIILDNLSELKTYNSDEQIGSFVKILHGISSSGGPGLVMLHLNNRPDDGIDDIIEPLGIEKVEIPNEVCRN